MCVFLPIARSARIFCRGSDNNTKMSLIMNGTRRLDVHVVLHVATHYLLNKGNKIFLGDIMFGPCHIGSLTLDVMNSKRMHLSMVHPIFLMAGQTNGQMSNYRFGWYLRFK